jgi:hypothetical protein
MTVSWGGIGLVGLSVLDLRIDGAAIDRARTLLALDDPRHGQPHVQTDHVANHRRTKEDSHPLKNRRFTALLTGHLSDAIA